MLRFGHVWSITCGWINWLACFCQIYPTGLSRELHMAQVKDSIIAKSLTLIQQTFWFLHVQQPRLNPNYPGVFSNQYISGGGHTGLWCDTSPRRGLCHCLMPDYALRCRTSTMIMVPINFWRNSDPFKKEEHFSSSKMDRVRAFLINLSKFQ